MCAGINMGVLPVYFFFFSLDMKVNEKYLTYHIALKKERFLVSIYFMSDFRIYASCL